jgi:site-specific recombinase XerD
MKLEQYESVQYWLEGLGKGTTQLYKQLFPRFLQYCKTIDLPANPDKLIEMRKQDLKSEDRQTQKRFEHLTKIWYLKLLEQFKKEGKSEGHAYNHLKAVMSFFSRNDMPLRFKKREIPQPKKKIKYITLTIEDIKTMVEHSESLRNKALLLTLLQTGLSPIDVCALNIDGDFYERINKPPLYIQGYREKTDIPFQTCIGEDACIYIKRMLKNRGNPTSGALFLSHKGKRLTPRFVNEALNELAEKVGIKDFEVKHLRDMYNDAIARAKLSKKVEDRLMGHELGGARGSYWLSPTTIREAYLEAYQYLTINQHTHAKEFAWEKINELRIEDFTLIMGLFKAKYPEEFREMAKRLLITPITDIDLGTPQPAKIIQAIAVKRLLEKKD